MSKKGAKLFIKTAPEPQPVKMQKKTLERRSGKVWAFLENHPGIHIGKLITAIEYDSSNFRKYMNTRKKLPETLLLKVEKYLSDYGLNVY